MAAHVDHETIRLRVPAEADFVSVVRLASRIVAGRAGCGDDARSHLQAAVGAAFFALLEGTGPDASVAVSLTVEADRVLVELAGPRELDAERVGDALLGAGVDHEVDLSRHLVRAWVTR